MSTAPTDKPAIADGRKAPRRRVLKAGTIAFNNRHSTLQCTVRDLSDGGARLLIDGSINAPDTFELFVELDGLEASCAVVNRAPGEVRVKIHACGVCMTEVHFAEGVVPSSLPLTNIRQFRREGSGNDRSGST